MTGSKSRRLLFIVNKNAKSDITLSFKNFEEFEEENVISKNIRDLDKGLYNELLLDVFDYEVTA